MGKMEVVIEIWKIFVNEFWKIGIISACPGEDGKVSEAVEEVQSEGQGVEEEDEDCGRKFGG